MQSETFSSTYTMFYGTGLTNLHRGVIAAAVSFVFIGVLQFSDGPFIRPHPVVWRLVLSVSILYLLLLIVLLFQVLSRRSF